jgi:hypothetical protein
MAPHKSLLSLTVFAAAFALVSCGKKPDPGGATSASAAVSAAPPATAATSATATTTAVASGAASAPGGEAAKPPAGSPPADGKYERVTVEGVTVPMVQVMNSGAVVLVDTDGKKPRTWEEQYKRKRDNLLPGQYDIHKTDKNKNDNFEDETIDKEGLWVIDAKGNITKH